MSAFDTLRSFAESRSADGELIRDGITYGTARQMVAYITELLGNLAEMRLRALTAESMEEDAQQAAARFKAERDKLRVLLLRADEALSMAIDIDDPNLSPSERDWIITQARGTHSDITTAIEGGSNER